MREILFRGKRKDNGDFVYGDVSFHRDGRVYIRCWDRLECCPIYNAYEVDPTTVGQFTVQTDKNGTMIFEGDIVDPALIDGTHKGFSWGLQVVVFNHGAFCLKSSKDEITPMCNYSVNVQFEVLGNIHDNPELLEVQE